MDVGLQMVFASYGWTGLSDDQVCRSHAIVSLEKDHLKSVRRLRYRRGSVKHRYQSLLFTIYQSLRNNQI